MSVIHDRDYISYDVVTVREIGVRKLKASLSEVLRLVEGGERIIVTSRGRQIAEIVPPSAPISEEERLERMAALGRLTRPLERGPIALPPLAETQQAPSELILAEREEED